MFQQRRKNFSILVIPDDGSRTREFKVSAHLLKVMILFMGIGLILTLFGGLSIWRLKTWNAAMEKLQTENIQLRVEADKVQKLSQALERLKTTDQQIRTMLSGSVPLNEPSYDVPKAPAPESTESAATRNARLSTAMPDKSPRHGR